MQWCSQFFLFPCSHTLSPPICNALSSWTSEFSQHSTLCSSMMFWPLIEMTASQMTSMTFWSCACEPCVLTIVPLTSPSAHLHLISLWWAFPAITSLWSLLHLPSQPALSVKPPRCSEDPCPSSLLLNSVVSGLPCWAISSLKAGAIFWVFFLPEAFIALSTA